MVTRPRSAVALAVSLMAVTGLVALLAYGLSAQSADRTVDDALARSEAVAAPDFALEVLRLGELPAPLKVPVARAASDDRISLNELRGVAVVLNFWASWCEPCRAEAPVLERGWRDAGSHEVLFLGVDIQDLTGDAREFLDEFGVSYPNVRDPDNTVARRFGAVALPETYFISARGKVVSHVVGAVSPRQLRKGVRAARDGRPRRLGPGGERRASR